MLHCQLMIFVSRTFVLSRVQILLFCWSADLRFKSVSISSVQLIILQICLQNYNSTIFVVKAFALQASKLWFGRLYIILYYNCEVWSRVIVPANSNCNVSLATIIIMLTCICIIVIMLISITIIDGWHFYYFEPEHNYNDLMIENNYVCIFFLQS